MLHPPVRVRTDHGNTIRHPEVIGMSLDLSGGARVALDKRYRCRSAAERFKSHGARAREQVQERPVGNGLAENAKEALLAPFAEPGEGGG